MGRKSLMIGVIIRVAIYILKNFVTLISRNSFVKRRKPMRKLLKKNILNLLKWSSSSEVDDPYIKMLNIT